MSFLFPIEVHEKDIPAIPGLSYHPQYVTAAQEMLLTTAIDQGVWDSTWERRRQLFGGAYGNNKEKAQVIPVWGQQLAERMLQEGLTNRAFDQMLVNEYFPGQGIAMHLDYDPYDRTVVSLSLLRLA